MIIFGGYDGTTVDFGRDPYRGDTWALSLSCESWTELTRPRDLAKIFDTIEYTKWRSFR